MTNLRQDTRLVIATQRTELGRVSCHSNDTVLFAVYLLRTSCISRKRFPRAQHSQQSREKPPLLLVTRRHLPGQFIRPPRIAP